MAGFDRSYRRKIIDEYLNDTGNNVFEPRLFLGWLKERPDHRAYPIFFSKSDEEAAEEYRVGLVRQFVSGLKISVAVSTAPIESKVVSVRVEETPPAAFKLPAFISPIADRREGGGYHSVDPSDGATVRELARQAAADLLRFVRRNEGVASLVGVDISALKAIAAQFEAASATAEAA